MKRLAGLALAATAVLGESAPTFAQTAPAEPSVAGYLCTFAGECDPSIDAAAVTKDAPATKGFRLARAAPQASAAASTQQAPATKGFRMAAPRAIGPVAAVTPQRAIKPAVVAPARVAAYVPKRKSAAAPGAGARADLSIAFEFGSDRMTEAGLATAKIFQQSLQMPQMAGKRFAIEGHTDSTGDAARNLDLSRRRAQAVADFLKSNGVDGSRLEVKGMGSQKPLPGRRSSDSANRRVEAALIS